ncbi:MAG: hypothetical protein LAO07_14185 [Acidobacteriia bacterium]|nr:hypothetical protein [Terriglobia bacterium]
MKKCLCVLLFSCTLLLGVVPALAQVQPKTVAEVIFLAPKPGSAADFEAAVKRHMQWHRQQNDTWAWIVWEEVNGERMGQYVVGTFGHDWKDFDDRANFEKEDTANAMSLIGPYIQSLSGSFYAVRPDLSLARPSPGGPPSAFSSVTTVLLKPAGFLEAGEAIKEVNAAIKKSNWPAKPSAWYQLLNGGEGPTLEMVVAREKWADFQPPEKEFGQMLGESYGKMGAENLLQKFYGNVRSFHSEIIKFRPDLSYIPAAK